MARRSDHTKEELRELIFSSAKKIVIKKGYKELSARKLATKIGYTPGTIYSFFKNIDDLVMHINADTLDLIHEELVCSTSKVKSSEKAIKEIARTYVEFSFKNHNLWSLLFDFQYNNKDKLPDWYSSKVKRNFSLVEGFINCFCRNKTDVENLSRMLWASLHGIVILSSRGKLDTAKAQSAHELAELFAKNFIKGLKA